jgi:tRNA(Ile)-lysidine synthase
MRDLLHRVASFIRTHDLFSADRRVLAGVSGGADSVALAHVLAELERLGAVRFTAIIHFNHQLRAAADGDEAFVRDLAAGLNIPFLADRGDVRARAAREHRSLEDAGRVARHEFFERARVTLAADVVALGHTRDDQAETVLLRLVRGAGPRGLSGMHPRSGHVVRPLLDCRRSELREWLDERAVAHVEDLSNADVAIPRNRVRAELLPFLAERFNPNVVDVLADEAELARGVWQWLDEASAPALRIPHLVDLKALRAAPSALQRLIVWRALSSASGGRHISFDHVAAVIRLTQSDRPHATLDLPGQTVQRTGDQIVLRSERRSRQAANLFERALSIPGETHIPEAGCVVTASDAPAGGGATVSSRDEAVIRRDLVRESLVVRNRRPGDKFRPAGLRGSKKLQDLFVDAKVPRATRDSVPVVVDERNRIVWVAGFGIDEAFRVTDASQAVLVLRLTRS